MSIDKPVGAMSSYLTRLLSSKSYSSFRNLIKKISKTFPENYLKLYTVLKSTQRYAFWRNLIWRTRFLYLGPIDGHNLKDLISVLENIRDNKFNKPIFLHCITKKGKGYEPAEKADDKFHGVEKFVLIPDSQ